MKRIGAGLLLLGIFVLAGWWLSQLGWLEREGLLQAMEQYRPWAPLIVMAAMVVAVVIGPIPTIPVTVASGAILGPLWGTLYAIVGALLGATSSFTIARLAGRPFMERFLRGHVQLCQNCSDRMLFWVVLASRLIPVVSFALVSYAAGMTAMGLRAFLLATTIGMLPMTMVYIFVGTSLQVNPFWAAGTGIAVLVVMLWLPQLAYRRNWLGFQRLVSNVHTSPSQKKSDW